MKIPMTMAALATGLTLVAGSAAVARPATHADPATAAAPAAVSGSATARGPGAPDAGPATAGSPAAPAAVTAPSPQAGPGQKPEHQATVTLLTGDKVRIDTTSDGHTSATPLRTTTAPAANFMQFTWSGDTYVIPDTAVPYLSSTLDMRLFDVSYLARAGLDDAHQASLPVNVTTSSSAAPDLPGVHVTHKSGATATATIGKSTAVQLGRHLAQQWRAARTGTSTTAVGRLPGITRISLAPPSGAPALPAAPARTPQQAMAQAAAHSTSAATTTATSTSTTTSATTSAAQNTTQVSPHGQAPAFHTLTLDPIDRQGNPGTTFGFLISVDDPRFGFIISATNDQAPLSFSVPAGTYSAEISVFTGLVPIDASRLRADSALVVKPEITVDSDQTVTLDARTAVQFQATPQTPPPADYVRQDMLAFQRLGPNGGGVRVQAFGLDGVVELIAMRLSSQSADGNPPLFATPTEPVTKGTFHFAAFAQLAPPAPGTQERSRYTLAFPSDNAIPSSLTYQVPDSQLTAVRSKIYVTDCAACTPTPELWPDLFLPWSLNVLGLGAFVTSGEQTDYLYSSDPDHSIWQQQFNASDHIRRSGQRFTITPGQTIDESWGNTTYGPSPTAAYAATPVGVSVGDIQGFQVDDPTMTVCVACRQADIGMTNIQIYGDTGRGHQASILWETDPVLRFWRDGVLAVTSDALNEGAMNAAAALPLLNKPATYKLQWAWKSSKDPSDSSDTTWTFHSDPADSSTLPEHAECAPDPGQGCAFLPLLFVTYDLPLDFNSQAKASAPFQLTFSVAGQQNAPAPSGVSANVSVSYDDGKTWSDAQDANSLGNGKFGLTVNHPDLANTSGFVSLRIHAQDAAGNAVEQTTIHAYGLIS